MSNQLREAMRDQLPGVLDSRGAEEQAGPTRRFAQAERGGSGPIPAQASNSSHLTPSSVPRSESLSYEPYYGLKEKPFSLSADPKFLYKSPSHAPAFDELLAAIQRREGLTVLTGAIGTGKTTLCHAVLEHLDRKTFSTFVHDPFASREDLLKMLLIDFGVMSIEDLKSGRLKGASRTDLSYPLYEFLDSLVPLQAFAVLIIDEAQNLSLSLLEEVRILSDLQRREKLLQVILVGQPELRSNLKLPQMQQVDQRVTVRCDLAPLGRESVAGYVTHRLNVANGGSASVQFSAAALELAYLASGGVPRLVNLICDRALHRGWVGGIHKIEPEIIRGAIDDLDLSVPAAPKSVEPVLSIDNSAARGAVADSNTRQPSVPAQPEAGSSAPLAVFDSETEGTGDADEQLVTEGRQPAAARRSRRAWSLAATLVLASFIGAIGASFWYLRELGQTVVNGSSVPDLPAPPTLSMPRLAGPRFLDQATQMRLAAEAPIVGQAENFRAAGDRKTGYVIQVASFQSQERAGRLTEQLATAGYRVHQVELHLELPRGRLLQILVGGYETLEEAQIDLARIRQIPGYADARLREVGTGSLVNR